MLEAHAEFVKDQYDAILFASWHTAVLTNSGSKIPPLRRLIQRTPDPTDVLDGDDPEQIAAKQMMAAMMGATQARSINKANQSRSD